GTGEGGSVRELLRRPFTPAVLPNVVEYRQPALGGQRGDWIEQWIVGTAAREELDANGAALRAALDLAQCVLGVIRVHRRVHAHAMLLARRDVEHRIVAERDVGGRRKVRRRGETVCA